jgi:PAS domain S-box-containing protein
MTRNTLTWRDIAIIRNPLTAPPETLLEAAIAQLTNAEQSSLTEAEFTWEATHHVVRSSCVLVVEQGQLLGILTERDIIRLNAEYRSLAGLRIGLVMNKLSMTAKESTLPDLSAILTLFQSHPIHHLPILDNQNRLTGLVTPESLLQSLAIPSEAKFSQIADRQANGDENHAVIKEDGKVAWQQWSDRTIFDQNGQLIEFQSVGQDITERKEAEIALRQSEERYRLLTEISPVGVFRFDTQGQCVYVNETIAHLCGYPQDFILRNGWLNTVHPDDRQSAWESWQAFMDEVASDPSATHQLENRQLHPDGSVVWVLGQAVAEQDASGTITGYIGTLTDISDRKRAELALQASESQLQDVLKRVSGIIVQFRLFSDRTLEYIYYSSGAEALFGYSPQELMADYALWQSRIHPEDLQTQLAQKLDQFLAGNSMAFEYRFLHKDGTLRWISGTGTSQWDEAANCWIVTIVETDISERKQLEAERKRVGEQILLLNQELEDKVQERTAKLLEREQELLRATRLKDEFLATMSHELRTPLNAILGMTEGLLDGILGSINAAQTKALTTVERSGNHLLALINDILDLAKVESGTVTLDRVVVPVGQLCQSSLTFVRPQAVKKRIRLLQNLPDRLPNIWVDERRFLQILINLLSNAVKFTPEGGQVTLDVMIQPHASEGTALLEGLEPISLQIAVTDTGIGIAPDDLEKMFQPFVQIDGALNRQQAGTGLGLALVKRLVELHGGSVEAASEENVGSCFVVTIPYSTTGTTSSEPVLPKTNLPLFAPDEPTLVLLVEDNAANAQTITSYLRAKGYDLLWAKSGQEGITLAQSENPHIILMDIQMPEMDGLEATQQIRQDPRLANVPIIALTALAMEGDRDRCFAAGANDYLSKPIRLKQLVDRIQQLLAEATPQCK